jgi:hypothetical protein
MTTANLASPNSTDPNDPRQKQLGGPIQNVPQFPMFRNFTDFSSNPIAQDRVSAMVSQGGAVPQSASLQASMQAQGLPMRQPGDNPPAWTPPAPSAPAPVPPAVNPLSAQSAPTPAAPDAARPQPPTFQSRIAQVAGQPSGSAVPPLQGAQPTPSPVQQPMSIQARLAQAAGLPDIGQTYQPSQPQVLIPTQAPAPMTNLPSPSGPSPSPMQPQGLPMRQLGNVPPPFTPAPQAAGAAQSPAQLNALTGLSSPAPQPPVTLPPSSTPSFTSQQPTSLQGRLAQAAGLPDIEQTYQQWRQENPTQLEQPEWSGASKGRKLLDVLRVAAGAIGRGVPGAVGQVASIHDHDLPQNLDQANRQRFNAAVIAPLNAQLGAVDTASQIGERNSQTALNQGKLTQLPLETQIKQQAAQGTLAAHGLKQVTDDQGNVSIAPDEDSPVYQHQQAQTEYIGAQQQLDQARTAYQHAAADAKTNPNNPTLVLRRQALAIAMKNAQTAAGRLGLSTLQYDMRAHGTDATGNALPGAVLEDDDTPVGTAFQANVRPTGTERNKGDMATSAHEQLGTLKQIVDKRPDIFGSAAGRVTDFNVWLGSQDPDAQRFRAARTIAGDHLAGTFGGRSEAALSAIDNAIGNFKDNPAAVSAGLDELDKANSVFLNRGTPRVSNGRGGRANAPSTSQGGNIPDQAAAQLREGVLHTFGNGQVWTKKNGNPVRVR